MYYFLYICHEKPQGCFHYEYYNKVKEFYLDFIDPNDIFV